MQLLVSVLLVVTYPGGSGKGAVFRGSGSLQGVFEKGDRLSVLVPLMGMVVFSGMNVVFVGPRTIALQYRVVAGRWTSFVDCECVRVEEGC